MDVFAVLVSIASVVFGIVSLVALVVRMRRRPATTGVTDATVELASTDAHRAALARGVRFAKRLFSIMAVSFPVVLLGAGAYLAQSNPRMSIVESLAIVGVIGATIALIIGAIGWWQVRALRADLQRGVFLRTTGPVRVTTIRHGSFLDLVDRSFGVTYDVGHAATYADVYEVDHSPRGHYVFEMRDRSGAVVYRDKHYRPDS
jgi:hypothetical protein